MTVGEAIQTYRKDLGISQEELGQKLCVSRQTISLWEKNQTVPTVDNLLRLKDVFGVSVDEILGVETKQPEELPKEVYQFHFTSAEVQDIYRLQRSAALKKPMTASLLLIFLLLFLICDSAPSLLIGIAFGMLFMGLISQIKGIFAYHKAWKKQTKRICASTYEYQIFEDFILRKICRQNEQICESKCYFAEIEQIESLAKWLFYQAGGELFALRKNALKENSAFYSYMNQNPSKTVAKAAPSKWEILSTVLFAASLLSIYGALSLLAVVSDANHLFVENTWVFFLLTPIPIASAVVGLVRKSKGYPYKKNLIAGIIVTILLCIYGSFSFLF